MLLSESEYVEKCRAIARRLQPLLDEANVVHAYWPMVHRREIDTRLIIDGAFVAGKTVVLPVVRHFTREEQMTPRMTHHQYQGLASLQRNRWGILEPCATPSVSVHKLDLVLVPAIGVDRQGVRMGHGWGFYDEFLTGLAIPRVCLAFDVCVVDLLPSEPHDVEMTHIITESETICLSSV